MLTETDVRVLIRELVEKNPGKTAIQFGGVKYSYQELYERSSKIVCHLKTLHVEKGDVVAIVLDKSLDLIASMLATMHLGLAFCIFDVLTLSEFEKRYLHNLSLAKPKIILTTNSHFPSDLAASETEKKTAILYVENIKLDKSTVMTSMDSPVEVNDSDLAYIAFTSGSENGMSKGIKIPWEAIYSRIYSHTNDFGIGNKDVVAQFCPLTVDAFIFEVLIALTVGATLDLIPLVIVKQGWKELIKYYDKNKITVACFVPGVLKQIMLAELKFFTLRLIFSVGEDTTTDLCDYFSSEKTDVVNGYGPTEATIAAIYTKHVKGAPINLGKEPIRGVVIELRAVIDKANAEEGEIFISGKGLALGYIGASEEQNKRFDPIVSGKKRYYKTGDIAKYDKDNNLVFCRRIGNEYKINGNFVATSEIVEAIKECKPEHLQAVEIKVNNQKNIHAHLTLTANIEPQSYFLDIAKKLFGKLDSNRFPARWSYYIADNPNWKPINSSPQIPQIYLAKSVETKSNFFGENEKLLKTIFEKLLLTPDEYKSLKPGENCLLSIGIHDNFYYIGGNSLLCSALASHFTRELKISFPYHLFNKHPTISFLLRFWYRKSNHQDICVLKPLNDLAHKNLAKKTNEAVFIIHALLGDVEGTYFKFANNLPLNRPVFGFSSWGLLGEELMPESVDELADSLIHIMRNQQEKGPYFLIGWSFGGIIAKAMAHQLRKQGEQVCAIMLDSTCPSVFKTMDKIIHSKYIEKLVELTRNYINRKFPQVDPDFDKKYEIESVEGDTKQQCIKLLFDRVLKVEPKDILYNRYIRTARDNALLTLDYSNYLLEPDDVLFVAKTKTVPGRNIENLGWTSGNAKIYQMPGDHFDMVDVKEESDVVTQIIKTLQEFKNKITSNNQVNALKLWNVPVLPAHFIAREKLLKKIEQHLNPKEFKLVAGKEISIKKLEQYLNQKEVNQQDSLVVITAHGLGGVGKTLLAAKYALDHKEHYKYILWFSAESDENLSLEYYNLANALHLQTKDQSPNNIIELIKNYLEQNTGWLIIYDNAPEAGLIAKFCPRFGGNILITSRKDGWDKKQSLSINVFSLEEAHEYIVRLTGYALNENQSDIDKLAKVLGRLPLALAQACAYIAVNKISLQAYLNLYEQDRKEMLADNTMPAETIHDPVAVTWRITFKAIGNQCKEVLPLLVCCAYLNANNIPESIIKSLYQSQQTEVSDKAFIEALGCLRQYNILKLTQETLEKKFSMHCLVQDVIYDSLSEERKLGYLLNVYEVLKVNYPYGPDKQQLQDYAMQGVLLPHLESVLKRSEELKTPFIKNQNLTDNQPTILELLEKDHILYFIIILANGYANMGDSRKDKELLERALQISEKYYDADHINIGKILINLGAAYGTLGDILMEIKLLERALSIFNKQPCEFNIEVANILNNLATAYGTLGDVQQSKKLLEHALPIVEKHYGENHPETCTLLTNLANTYHLFGDVKKGIELLERVLAIFNEHYDADHPKIAQTLKNLANTYGVLGDSQNKKKLLERALTIQEKYYCKDHPNIGLTLLSLFQACLQDLNIQQANEHIQRAHIIFLHHPDCGQSHPYTLRAKELIDNFNQLIPYLQQVPLLTHVLTHEKALRQAAGFGTEEEVAFLAKLVKNINAQDDNPLKQKTALHWAVEKCKIGNIKILLEAGASCDIKDAANQTAMDYAQASTNGSVKEKIIELLSQTSHQQPLSSAPIQSQSSISNFFAQANHQQSSSPSVIQPANKNRRCCLIL